MTPGHVLVIGGARCGTSSLHRYLALHPGVAPSLPKETDFFVAERNWRHGPAWYARTFQGEGVRVDASPAYTNHPRFDGVPERARATVPHARLVMLVRDPVERLLSHLGLAGARGAREDLPRRVLDDLDNPYVHQSRYFHQLSRWLACWPRDALLVVATEDLADRRDETLRRVLVHAGLDPTFHHPDLDRRHGTAAQNREDLVAGRGRPPVTLTPSQRERLRAALAPDVARLRELVPGLPAWTT